MQVICVFPLALGSPGVRAGSVGIRQGHHVVHVQPAGMVNGRVAVRGNSSSRRHTAFPLIGELNRFHRSATRTSCLVSWQSLSESTQCRQSFRSYSGKLEEMGATTSSANIPCGPDPFGAASTATTVGAIVRAGGTSDGAGAAGASPPITIVGNGTDIVGSSKGISCTFWAGEQAIASMKRLTISPIMEALLKIPLDLENSRVERSRRSRCNFVGRDTKLSLAPKVRIGR